MEGNLQVKGSSSGLGLWGQRGSNRRTIVGTSVGEGKVTGGEQER